MKPQSDAKRVCEVMKKLKRALADTIECDEDIEELAFNLADILPDIVELMELFEKVERGCPLDATDLRRINYFMSTHWPYHAKEIDSVMKRARIIE